MWSHKFTCFPLLLLSPLIPMEAIYVGGGKSGVPFTPSFQLPILRIGEEFSSTTNWIADGNAFFLQMWHNLKENNQVFQQ